MASVGLLINIAGAILITLATYLWGTYVFEIEMGVLPDWATIGPEPIE